MVRLSRRGAGHRPAPHTRRCIHNRQGNIILYSSRGLRSGARCRLGSCADVCPSDRETSQHRTLRRLRPPLRGRAARRRHFVLWSTLLAYSTFETCGTPIGFRPESRPRDRTAPPPAIVLCAFSSVCVCVCVCVVCVLGFRFWFVVFRFGLLGVLSAVAETAARALRLRRGTSRGGELPMPMHTCRSRC